MTRKRTPLTEWSKDDTHFKIIKQGTTQFEAVSSQARVKGSHGQPSTILYDSVALRYNQCAPGDLFLISLPNNPSLFNLRKHLRARGVQEMDYRMFRPTVDENGICYRNNKRPVAIQRLTNARMTPLQPFPTEAALLAKEAEERGADSTLLQVTNPVKPGPVDEFSAGNGNVVNT